MLASLCLREMIYYFNFILKGKRKRENKTEHEIHLWIFLFFFNIYYNTFHDLCLEYNK